MAAQIAQLRQKKVHITERRTESSDRQKEIRTWAARSVDVLKCKGFAIRTVPGGGTGHSGATDETCSGQFTTWAEMTARFGNRLRILNAEGSPIRMAKLKVIASAYSRPKNTVTNLVWSTSLMHALEHRYKQVQTLALRILLGDTIMTKRGDQYYRLQRNGSLHC